MSMAATAGARPPSPAPVNAPEKAGPATNFDPVNATQTSCSRYARNVDGVSRNWQASTMISILG